MKPIRLLALVVLAVALPAYTQVPNTLFHSIPAPPVGAQTWSQLGSSVAVDAASGLTVAGAPSDDLGGSESGVVKVFDSATGALLHLILNPSPANDDNFGHSVAISGTRVVIGAAGDETGASNAGSAYVYDLSSNTPTVPVATLNNPSPADNDFFGISVAISGTRVVIGANGDKTGAENAGSAYVYDLSSGTPTVPVATLHNPSPTDYDNFGTSVAISGARVVVGAAYDDTGAIDTGSAYVYDLGSGTPIVPVAALHNPNPANNDNFGTSVAISGTQVVVGAYGDDAVAINSGSAYVYDLASGTPSLPIANLNNPSPEIDDFFGWSVAISGKWVVVGAQGDNSNALDAGSIYVYDLVSGTPTSPLITVNNPSQAEYDSFGISVAISGSKVVVGAPYDDTGAVNAGSAYVYDLNSGTPTLPMAKLNNPSPATHDYFGYSVAVSGTRVVVGAYGDDVGATNAGSAYVYDLASGTPTIPIATLNNPSPETDDLFGWSVAISGTRIVVGASRDDTGADMAGRAYVYDLSSATPKLPVHTLNNPSPAAGDSFGISVAISGTKVVVGAFSDDTGANNAGSVYVYDVSSGTPTVPMHTLSNPSPATSDLFGYSVAISGTRVAIGAPYDDTGATNAGSAYVYELTNGTPAVPVATLNNPGPEIDDFFGFSTAISGARVVVGAYRDNTGATDAGSAYVYDLDGGTPNVPVHTLNNPSPAVSDDFGFSVAISGTWVVVGAYADDTGENNAGSAYIYDLSSARPNVAAATLNNPSPANFDFFGHSVALDGTTVVIGTPYDDTVAFEKGSTYIFNAFRGLVVEVQPTFASFPDGGSHDFGIAVTGSTRSVTFTLKNTGYNDLILTGTPKVAVSGTHGAMFAITAQPTSPITAPTGMTTFTVQFLPTSGGVKTAALSIPSNDVDESPFDIHLTGTALAFTDDTDADGLNDASEFQMAALGYDWQVSQPALVNTLMSSATGAGLYNQTLYNANRTAGQNDVINSPNTYSLYTLSQVQALNVGTPLIQRHPTTGVFTLTLGVEKSTTLLPGSFTPFPMTGAGTSTVINGQGKLEFQFTVPDNAAFFQLRTP